MTVPCAPGHVESGAIWYWFAVDTRGFGVGFDILIHTRERAWVRGSSGDSARVGERVGVWDWGDWALGTLWREGRATCAHAEELVVIAGGWVENTI